MSLKNELLIYSSALEAFDTSNLSLALTHFGKISETSKIQWNMGIILATMGRHNEAIARFGESILMDQYLVVGWFQRGVSYFMVGMYALAEKDFDMALLYMRGNRIINYTQLGLAHTIHSAEILYNLGLTKTYLGQIAAGMLDLRRAQAEKSEPDHQVIDDCIRDHGRGYNVFSLPIGMLFRPSESKLKNIKTRDYMGKAFLISATDSSDEFTTFTGITRLQRGQTPQGVPLDPDHPLSRSQSKSRDLARSASSANLKSNITLDHLPIASQMTTTLRNQTTRVPPTPSAGPLGYSRSLTISNPDPTSPRSPMRHIRSKTIDSPRSTEYPKEDLPDYSLTGIGRPTRPRIVIPSTTTITTTGLPASQPRSADVDWNPRADSGRYPSFKGKTRVAGTGVQPSPAHPNQSATSRTLLSPNKQDRAELSSSFRRNRPYIPAPTQLEPVNGQVFPTNSNTSEVLRAPHDRFEGLQDIYDTYHSPTIFPDLVEDLPELPYTAIGQAFTGVSPIRPKQPLPVQRALSRSRPMPGGLGRADTQSRGKGGGLLLTVEDQVSSPVTIDQELVKIRIKVHIGKHTRGMSILPTETYSDLISDLHLKFPELRRQSRDEQNGTGELRVLFKDEDGDMMSMEDDGDFEAAVDVARVMSLGRAEGRLEIWVE